MPCYDFINNQIEKRNRFVVSCHNPKKSGILFWSLSSPSTTKYNGFYTLCKRGCLMNCKRVKWLSIFVVICHSFSGTFSGKTAQLVEGKWLKYSWVSSKLKWLEWKNDFNSSSLLLDLNWSKKIWAIFTAYWLKSIFPCYILNSKEITLLQAVNYKYIYMKWGLGSLLKWIFIKENYRQNVYVLHVRSRGTNF